MQLQVVQQCFKFSLYKKVNSTFVLWANSTFLNYCLVLHFEEKKFGLIKIHNASKLWISSIVIFNCNCILVKFIISVSPMPIFSAIVIHFVNLADVNFHCWFHCFQNSYPKQVTIPKYVYYLQLMKVEMPTR